MNADLGLYKPKTMTPLLTGVTPVLPSLLQRKCACGQDTVASGECAECRQKRLGLQRKAVNQSAPQAVPPIVHEVLRSPGRPLDPATRAYMEPRFGRDFSQVRVHTDTRAADSAEAVNALAYTVGRDVVFGAGQYGPGTSSGKRLLAHELAHTVQQNGQKNALVRETTQSYEFMEQEAEAAALTVLQGGVIHPTLRVPIQIARQDQTTVTQTPAPVATPTAATPQPMKRTEFDRIMKGRYGVTTIRTGTFQEQAFDDMKQDEWKAWDPDSSPTVYNWIVEAFVNFEKTFGGLPPIKEIVFFDTRYQRDNQGKAVKDPYTGASYGLGQLTLYRAVQQSNRMFNLQGVLELPTSDQAIKRNITHELGHGIAETALNQRTDQPPGADPDLIKDYDHTVGWTQDEKLYDIQEKAVQDAFKNNTPPPAQFQIKPENVDTKPWKERPLTRYMADNPGDDFAEAIMAYVNEPERLQALSPTRYDFIHKRKARWLASGQPKMNIWKRINQGGPARTLKPSRRPTIWERVRGAQ